MVFLKNIVLIGLMGAGKTSVSVALASFLPEFSIIDMDKLLEHNENCTINEIFKTKGEKYFRKKETELAKKLSKDRGQIISTGGGIVENLENIEYLKKTGMLFYLQTDIETLYERIKTDSSRPLLQNDSPKEVLSKLLEKREPFYKMADVTINVSQLSPTEIAEEIKNLYEQQNY